jgi:hypothetical protein
MKADLATKEAVERVWAMYVSLFAELPTSSINVVADINDNEIGMEAWLGLRDLGVEEFAEKSDTELHELLDFPHGRPLIFAALRSLRGLSGWVAANLPQFREDNPDMVALALLWHQLGGVAAMAVKLWVQAKSPTLLPGILLTDGVGLGKSCQIMGFIALVIQVWAAETADAGRRPPLLGECSFLALWERRPYATPTSGPLRLRGAPRAPATCQQVWRTVHLCGALGAPNPCTSR